VTFMMGICFLWDRAVEGQARCGTGAAQPPQPHCDTGPPAAGVEVDVGVAEVEGTTCRLLVTFMMGICFLWDRAVEGQARCGTGAAQPPQPHCDTGPPGSGIEVHVGVAGLESMTSKILVIAFISVPFGRASGIPRA